MERKVELVTGTDGKIRAQITVVQGNKTEIVIIDVSLQQAYQQLASQTEARAQHLTNFTKGLENFDAEISAWKEIVTQLEAIK